MGFIGVLLISQPEAEQFNWFALLPILSAVLYAFAMILTRSRCRNENVFILSAWLNISMLIVDVMAFLLMAFTWSDGDAPGYQAFLFGPWTEMGTRERDADFVAIRGFKA